MKLNFYQLQYAVSEAEYEAIQDNAMSVKDLPVKKVTAILTKETDIGDQATPHIGESVSDSYWPSDFSEQKVTNVCYSYSDNTCTITLEPFVMVADSMLHTELERIATLHGRKYQKL